MVLIVFQCGYEQVSHRSLELFLLSHELLTIHIIFLIAQASLMTEQRKTLSRSKGATLQWNSEKEVKWRSALEVSRSCEAIWIGS